ncbi:uncharacterized protein [Miscanthus floridulus]|uniref:uncharacterized protein n=1 Tax=Miscanthus floridulus TaxID=154761 RepID=UPI0034591692
MGSGSKEGDEWVLSHGDVVLIRSDLAILRGPRFINDRIIAFYFAHLCGVYVMAIARAICAWWNEAQDHRGRGGDWLEVVRREVDARSVKAMSTDLLQLINTLIQEKAKPNSISEGDTIRLIGSSLVAASDFSTLKSGTPC